MAGAATETPLDFNKIAALTAAQVLESMAKRLSGPVASQFLKVRHSATQNLGKYINDSLSRHSVVRTILHSGEDTLVDSIYVSPSFMNENRRRRQSEVVSSFRNKGRVIIRGTAGGGKSVFVKRLTCELLQSYVDILPVHFELRDMNDEGDKDLLAVIHAGLHRHIKTMSRDIFDKEVSSGHIGLILDGFDEVNHEIRSRVAKEIAALCSAYPSCRVLITTRPEEGLESLPLFDVFEVLPLTKSQCKQLLKKIDYEKKKKLAFIKRVDDGLYEDHRDFLSNPLLITMMLMTFAEAGEVPNKLTNFYKQAFEVLFYKHDRSKGVYTRRTYSGLEIDEFDRFFSFFCARTYADEKFVFGDVEVRNYINESLKYEQSSVSAEDVLNDLLKSVCLLQRDGISYSFVHRSFQEYFTAIFICKQDALKAKVGLDAVIRRSSSDSVINMSYQINPDLVESSWVKPWVDHIDGLVDPLRTAGKLGTDDASLKAFFSIFWTKAFVSTSSMAGFLMDNVPTEGLVYNKLESIYRDIEEKIGYNDSHEDVSDRLAGFFANRISTNPSFSQHVEDLFDGVDVKMRNLDRSPLRSINIKDAHEAWFAGCGRWALRNDAFLRLIKEEVGRRVISKDESFHSLFL